MALHATQLKELLCKSLCTEVQVHERSDGRLLVETPFSFGDGDLYSIYLESLPTGGVRVTDAGHTLMQLSYTMDVDKLKDGTRDRIFQKVLAESGVRENEGEIFVDTSADQLGQRVVQFGQALTRIHDLTFLNRARTESTFYDDLHGALLKIVSPDKVKKDFIDPAVGVEYPIDFRIEGKADPLFIFGIPNRDKARLATIILERYLRERVRFDSLVVFARQEEIPRLDLARLTNAAGEMVASLDAEDDLRRKVLKRAA